jgi:hypothetical protein
MLTSPPSTLNLRRFSAPDGLERLEMALTGTKTRGLIFLLVVVVLAYIGWNLIPPYFTNSQFQESIEDIARKTTYIPKTDEEIKTMVLHQAQLMEIPIKEDQVIITRGSDGLGISVSYRIHVDLPVHPVDLDFTANTRNRRI